MAPKVIVLRGTPIQKESLAASATTIVPGDLLERASATEVQEHSTAAGNAVPMFADFRPWVEASGLAIDEVYPVGDTVIHFTANPGDEVYARLATSQTIAVGDYLESAGDGTLREVAASAATSEAQRASTVGRAVEAVTTTTAILRLRVEVV